MYPSADWCTILSGALVELESGVDFPTGAVKQAQAEVRDVAMRHKLNATTVIRGCNLVVQVIK